MPPGGRPGEDKLHHTFCRMTKVILKEQLERNVFTYVNDIVVVSSKRETQL
jgi:hypothetical protein